MHTYLVCKLHVWYDLLHCHLFGQCIVYLDGSLHRLDLSREEAVQYMQGIIQESLGALFPQVVDVVHRWRLFFKT